MKALRTPINLLMLSILILVLCSCNGKKQSSDEGGPEPQPEQQEQEPYQGDLPLGRLNLPEGFEVDVFAEGIDGARSMALGDDGTLFVGTRNENKVYALRDEDGDYRADAIFEVVSGVEQPNGVAFRDGSLYVAAVGQLFKSMDIEQHLDNPPEPETIYSDYPTEFHHGWKYIAFGPDGKLYVPVGAPCTICDRSGEDERFATITRMDPDGSNREIIAKGVRNTVGFTWHPQTDQLWYTDNGRDKMGVDVPPCELNRLAEVGQHCRYPICLGGTVIDPEFGDQHPCSDFVPPVQNLGAHVAPLVIKFDTGNMFPQAYKGHAFIAEHGSWNRSSKVGYRITLVKLENNQAVSYEPFIDGWLDQDSQEAFGRPVDLLFLEDGSLLISDDVGDAIYRITYKG